MATRYARGVSAPPRRLRTLARSPHADVWLVEGADGLRVRKEARDHAPLPEIAVLRAVQHPGLVRMLDADPEGRWVELEHLPGGRADQVLRDHPLPERTEAIARVAEALDALHRAGLPHGDLKPSNVVLDADGHPRLIDPGGRGGGLVAPERLQGAPPSPAADRWGLGAWAWQLITGEPPFGRDAASAMAALSTLPEPPSAVRPEVPRMLDALVLALLAHTPSARPGPAGALADAFRAAGRARGDTRPVVGMARTRDTLRRAVVRLLDGVGGVWILHGRPGTGRRTLIEETAAAARREGLPVRSAGDDRRRVLAEVFAGGPSVLTVDGLGPEDEALLLHLLTDAPPCLVLVRARRPSRALARLGAQHLAPEPLDERAAVRLLGARGVPLADARVLHARTRGHPGAVVGLVSRRDPGTLPHDLRRLYDALVAAPRTVEELAVELGLPPVAVADRAEALLDAGWLLASPDGWTLSVPRGAQARASR